MSQSMDADKKSLGESSNSISNHNSKLTLNNSSTSHNKDNHNSSSHQPASSSVALKQAQLAEDSADGISGDDVGWWNCSLCTYKNSADRFKCEICDLRRGTSTRKPRCNADNIVAQVVKQQEQIRQQTVVKTPKSRPKTSIGSVAATSSNDTNPNPTPKSSKQTTKSSHRRRSKVETSNQIIDDSDSSSVSLPQPKKKKARDPRTSKSANNRVARDDEDSTDSDVTDATDDVPNSPTHKLRRSASESSVNTSYYSSSSPEPTTSSHTQHKQPEENPFKITPIEVSGNLIKYSPPTASGRTGLVINRDRYTQRLVTVNDVTITFTEFATRENKYVKKKKRKDKKGSKSSNASCKTKAKGNSKLGSNDASLSTSNNS